jgi:hypothetical protein
LAQALTRAEISSDHFFLMQHGETRLLKRDSKGSLQAWPAERRESNSKVY